MPLCRHSSHSHLYHFSSTRSISSCAVHTAALSARLCSSCTCCERSTTSTHSTCPDPRYVDRTPSRPFPLMHCHYQTLCQIPSQKIIGSFKVALIHAINCFIIYFIIHNGIVQEIDNGMINGLFLINSLKGPFFVKCPLSFSIDKTIGVLFGISPNLVLCLPLGHVSTSIAHHSSSSAFAPPLSSCLKPCCSRSVAATWPAASWLWKLWLFLDTASLTVTFHPVAAAQLQLQLMVNSWSTRAVFFKKKKILLCRQQRPI